MSEEDMIKSIKETGGGVWFVENAGDDKECELEIYSNPACLEHQYLGTFIGLLPHAVHDAYYFWQDILSVRKSSGDDK